MDGSLTAQFVREFPCTCVPEPKRSIKVDTAMKSIIPCTNAYQTISCVCRKNGETFRGGHCIPVCCPRANAHKALWDVRPRAGEIHQADSVSIISLANAPKALRAILHVYPMIGRMRHARFCTKENFDTRECEQGYPGFDTAGKLVMAEHTSIQTRMQETMKRHIRGAW